MFTTQGHNSTRQRAFHVIERAQAAFQHRLNRIEVELEEAKHALEKLTVQSSLSSDHVTAVCMSQQARLGKESPMSVLSEDLLRSIIDYAREV